MMHRVQSVRKRGTRSTIVVHLDPGMIDWLHDEAARLGAGVSNDAVIVAILRDAMAEGAGQ